MRDLWGNEIPQPEPKLERKPRPKRKWRSMWTIERDADGLPCRMHWSPPACAVCNDWREVILGGETVPCRRCSDQ